MNSRGRWTEFYEDEIDDGWFGSLGLHVLTEVIGIKYMTFMTWPALPVLSRMCQWGYEIWDWGHFCQEHAGYAPPVHFSWQQGGGQGEAVFPRTPVSLGLPSNSRTGGTLWHTFSSCQLSLRPGKSSLTQGAGCFWFNGGISIFGGVVAREQSQKRMYSCLCSCSFSFSLIILPFSLTYIWSLFKLSSGNDSSVKASLTAELSWLLPTLNPHYFYYDTNLKIIPSIYLHIYFSLKVHMCSCLHHSAQRLALSGVWLCWIYT